MFSQAYSMIGRDADDGSPDGAIRTACGIFSDIWCIQDSSRKGDEDKTYTSVDG